MIIRIFTLFICLNCWNVAILGQRLVTIDQTFERVKVTPDLLRDPALLFSKDSLLAGYFDQQFWSAGTPYLAYGKDPANWWLHFSVENTFSDNQPVVIRINRKNFDALHLFLRLPDGRIQACGAVGAAYHNIYTYQLTDGFHYALTLPPGKNELYALVSNQASAMHLMISVHTPDDFEFLCRRNGVLFGVFVGVMAVSIFFCLFLYFQSKDNLYLFYLAYVANILLREAYSFSTDYGFLPLFQRYATSVCIAITFGLFFRKFIRLDQLNPKLDKVVKVYLVFVAIAVVAILIVANTNRANMLNPITNVVTYANLIFTFLAILTAVRYYRTSVRAKILTLAYSPLGFAFIAILLRNLDIIPNYPIIQHAVMWGFVLEVLIFTIGFASYHLSIDTEKNVLEYKLAIEAQAHELTVQRVKDRIARDLHDDVSASMSGIRILSEVAENQVRATSPESAPLLAQISQNAQQVLESFSDLIWAVKPSHDYLNDLADRIRQQALVLGAKGIDYQVDIPRDLPVLGLDPEKRRNTFLVFKEALNNAVKYSACSALTIKLSYVDNQMNLVVQDNGIGFDPNEVASGNGLVNMYRRAADIGGQISIQSAPGAGTRVALTLDLT